MHSIKISLNKNNPGELFINDEKININEEFLILSEDGDGSFMYIPFRAILEALGSTVHWDPESGDIYFDYAGVNYVCIKHTENSFLVCKEEDKWKNDSINDKYLDMHTGSPYLYYRIIDAKTYMPRANFGGLLEELGCKTEISMGERTVKIWTE